MRINIKIKRSLSTKHPSQQLEVSAHKWTQRVLRSAQFVLKSVERFSVITRSTLTWSLSADHDCQNNEWKADKILKLGWRAVEQRLSHLNLIILPGFIYSGWTCRFPAEPQREALRWESEPLWTMMKTELSFFLLLTDSLLPSEASSLLSPLHQSHPSSFLQAAWGAARKTAARHITNAPSAG